MFTKAELQAIERRIPAERDAINAWWASLSDKQREVQLAMVMEDARQRERDRAVIAGITIVALIVIPGLLGCIEFAKMVFH